MILSPDPQSSAHRQQLSARIIEPACVVVPAGDFLMGCDQGRDEERPVHQVWVDSFAMAIHQVRNRDFAVFMEATGHPAPPNWEQANFNDPDNPVVSVNWFEAQKYCQWLAGLTGRPYRLPTEAEWERAARSGEEGWLYPWGNDPPPSRAEYQQRWGGKVLGPLPVGHGEPNPYGIYDLCENVHEWCADFYQADYYAKSPRHNPSGPAASERRASRGGSWRHHIKVSRIAARSSIPPEFQYADYGFRVVREHREEKGGGGEQ
ncbi:MAG: SUMF1/EgtB/PvdO family nonheme iron enzyme [Acidobacteriota bacterium]|nr:SUMF1/EgtB/PvdO family nonheme iron enzyme [Acidobacteriota bacterium]